MMNTNLTIIVTHVRNAIIARSVIVSKDREAESTCSKNIGEYRLAGCLSFVPSYPGFEHLVGEYPLGGD